MPVPALVLGSIVALFVYIVIASAFETIVNERFLRHKGCKHCGYLDHMGTSCLHWERHNEPHFWAFFYVLIWPVTISLWLVCALARRAAYFPFQVFLIPVRCGRMLALVPVRCGRYVAEIFQDEKGLKRAA